MSKFEAESKKKVAGKKKPPIHAKAKSHSSLRITPNISKVKKASSPNPRVNAHMLVSQILGLSRRPTTCKKKQERTGTKESSKKRQGSHSSSKQKVVVLEQGAGRSTYIQEIQKHVLFNDNLRRLSPENKLANYSPDFLGNKVNQSKTEFK